MKAFSELAQPLAITMWDFSWLERRWPGAGYEDWDEALDGLAERGYDAVRIDAYPHLVASEPHKTWDLLPCWNQQDWGSPALNRVQVLPALAEFIQKCAERKIKVGLSTWFRQDAGNTHLQIKDGIAHAHIWIKTLEHIEKAGLLEHILYVDLCNEWPLDVWAPFYKNPNGGNDWRHPSCLQWMEQSTAEVRKFYPQIPLTYSLWPDKAFQKGELSFFDFLEPHIWMVQQGDFYSRVGYKYERFESIGYENIVRHAEPLYRSNPDLWQAQLKDCILWHAELSRRTGHPLMTTECWAIVDYKDWPLLDWGWVKELCAIGVETAAETGRWAAIATSNFCGPQFRGMWRDVAWHQQLTKKIHQSKFPGRD